MGYGSLDEHIYMLTLILTKSFHNDQMTLYIVYATQRRYITNNLTQ